MHVAQVNGSRLKKYVCKIINVVCDGVLDVKHDVIPHLTMEEDLGLAIKFMFDNHG